MATFKCSLANTTSGSQFCFNGGTCAPPNPSFPTPRCICPPGYSGDATLFSLPNCTVPDDTFLAFAVIATVLFGLLGMPLMIYVVKGLRQPGKLHGKVTLVWRISVFALLTMGFSWATVVAIWLQDGLMEAGAIFNALIVISGDWMSQMINQLLHPEVMPGRGISIQNKRRDTFVRAMYGICVMTCDLVVAATCRWNDLTTRNAAIVSLICVVAIFGAFDWLLPQSSAIRLQNEMARTQGALQHDRFNEAMRRLGHYRFTIVASNLSMLTIFGALVAVYFVLGSFPYQWVLMQIICVGFGIFVTGISTWLGFIRRIPLASSTTAPSPPQVHEEIADFQSKSSTTPAIFPAVVDKGRA